MDRCVSSLNATLGNSSITWDQATQGLLSIPIISSYLRPDAGAALLPWIYTAVLIILHLPVVIIRVVRWEIVQSWCLVATCFTVVVYVQAYVSTKFDPAKVLVWTPLILVIDAGSMLQLFFLVIEAKKMRIGQRIVLLDKEDSETGQTSQLIRAEDGMPNATSNTQVYSSLISHAFHERYGAKPQNTSEETELGSTSRHRDATPVPHREANERELAWYRDPALYNAVCAALLFLAVLILQLYGLAKAAEALRASSEAPLVSWCSPVFQPFGSVAVDGDCHIFTVNQSISRGIGCVYLPGLWQRQWLKGTVAGVSFELVFEFVDFLILCFVNGKTKIFREVKMKRPWTTIFSGAIVLIVTLLYGLLYSYSLPPGIASRVTIVMDVQGPASYVGELSSAGLRGTLLGWNDGLFESWNTTYLGTGAP